MNEVYEIALSEDGLAYTNFESFTPGEVRLLANFVKFRVTVFGDFAEDDFRLRGFSGIVDDATTVVGGFGVSPFGRYPFGDGGICLEDSSGDLSGNLQLTGLLDVVFAENLSQSTTGTLALVGTLAADATFFSSESGSLAASGSVTTILTDFSLGVWISTSGTVGSITASTSNPFVSIASNNGAFTSASSAQVRMPSGATITAIYVLLTGNVLGTGAATFHLNINGSTSNALNVVIPSGSSSGNNTGSVALVADDLVCIEVTFTGTTSTANIRAVTIAYMVPN
jgi:hypothetical protein